ncbi:hypothetical protein GQ43DRAFT_370215 [Delitschia confertaspora ATCC 74209]|uniref:C2H2-type domain-containing protein n=1 Tax=Delitschia confertaspora ATCC 74209 TaxID=1513339 RepID=A0A9P4MSY3_9PLEO|nr:hypothetical protein GQ43DRAFT_370215 [Delitschia confertaspora ATCC 74209]
MSNTSDAWEKDNWTAFAVWDIDRTFQQSYDAYKQVVKKNKKIRHRLVECFGLRPTEDDELAKSLTLGRKIHDIMETGRNALGSRFEKGDSTCHAIISAQLLRTHQEILIPILDYSLAPNPSKTIFPDTLKTAIITAAKSVRRTTLHALRAQLDRMRTWHLSLLPLPRLSVTFCPYAAAIQKDSRKRPFVTKKVKPHDRYDEREICPHCYIHIAVSAHSGLPDARRILFQSHLQPQLGQDAKFACESCYKEFDSSYGFLDHVFQREIGSERSCLKRWTFSSPDLHQVYRSSYVGSEKTVVEACLKKCLSREVRRMKTLSKMELEDEKKGYYSLSSKALSSRTLVGSVPEEKDWDIEIQERERYLKQRRRVERDPTSFLFSSVRSSVRSGIHGLGRESYSRG